MEAGRSQEEPWNCTGLERSLEAEVALGVEAAPETVVLDTPYGPESSGRPVRAKLARGINRLTTESTSQSSVFKLTGCGCGCGCGRSKFKLRP